MRIARMFGAHRLTGGNDSQNVAIDLAVGLITGLALVIVVWMLTNTLRA